MLWDVVAGKDCAKVLDDQDAPPKELGYMHTFSDWTTDPHRIEGELAKAIQQVCYRMRGYGRRAERFYVYLRFQDAQWRGCHFKFQTQGLTQLDRYLTEACMPIARREIRNCLKQGQRIRGVGLNTIELKDTKQLELFFREDEKSCKLYFAIDEVNNEFGKDTLLAASLKYRVDGKTHFLER